MLQGRLGDAVLFEAIGSTAGEIRPHCPEQL
jgi:hypothetical protein